MDVVFYEAFEEERAAIKRFLDKRVKAVYRPATVQESGDKRPPARLISIRTQSKIPSSWRSIEAVLTRSQGYDHLVQFANESGFKGGLGYLHNYCSRAVAEQAVLLMMMLLRKQKQQARQFALFDRDGLTGKECRGRSAAVVGVGHIGKEIIKLTKALGMAVYGVDIVKRLSSLKYLPLEEAIRRADAIFVALPLTKETDRLLGYRVLSKNKRQGVLINISRGDITPAKDLHRLIKKGTLGGLAMDVFENEPELAVTLRAKKRAANNTHQHILALGKLDNVIVTPHNAFNTEEALNEKARKTADAVKHYLSSGRFPSQISTR